MQILGVHAILDLPPEEITGQLGALAHEHRVFFIQLGSVDILSSTSLPIPQAYTEQSITHRTNIMTQYALYGLVPSSKENLPPATYMVDASLSEIDAWNLVSSHHRTKIKKAQKA
jgi:hypothetical protein